MSWVTRARVKPSWRAHVREVGELPALEAAAQACARASCRAMRPG
jgi:hypothetical protein